MGERAGISEEVDRDLQQPLDLWHIGGHGEDDDDVALLDAGVAGGAHDLTALLDRADQRAFGEADIADALPGDGRCGRLI